MFKLWKKSIFVKILVGIITPIMVILVLAAVLILNQVQKSLNSTIESDLQAQSQAASNQVSEFFTKYMELVRQMSCNESIVQMMRETERPGTSKDAPMYKTAAASMDNILKTDENIALVWSADFDSGESVRSGGVVRGKLTDYDITSRSWYTETMEKKALFITEPYEDSSTGNIVASVICPVYDGNEMLGLVAVDLTIDSLGTMMSAHRLGDSGYFILTTSDGMLIYHPQKDLVGKDVSEAQLSDNILKAITNNEHGMYVYRSLGTEAHGYLSSVGQTGWSVMSALPTEEFNSGYRQIQRFIFMVFGIGIVILVIELIVIARGIIRPLKRLNVAASAIADGDLNVSVSVSSQDETGQVAQSLKRTVDRLSSYIDYIDEISLILNKIANGDLDFKLTYDYAGEFSKIKDALENISSSLSETMSSINQASQEVTAGAEQVASGAQALSQGTVEQAGAIEELAATINEISQHVNKTAANANEAWKENGIAKNNVDICNQQMQELIGAMEDISRNSDEIGKIIKAIEDIAFQTNILALNAAVEAARAGVAGKGFAVVADEVRSLAIKSSDAAKSTSVLIEEAVKSVGKGMEMAGETGNSLSKVVASTQVVTESIDKIAKDADEQAASIAQVTQGVEQISGVVHTNSATAEESAAASEELSGQALMLKELVQRFKLRDDGENRSAMG